MDAMTGMEWRERGVSAIIGFTRGSWTLDQEHSNQIIDRVSAILVSQTPVMLSCCEAYIVKPAPASSKSSHCRHHQKSCSLFFDITMPI